MKTTTFKSENQRTIELLERNDVKEIKNEIYFDTCLADTLLQLVEKNANDFTKDIAAKRLNDDRDLSEKQAWCVAFQIKNNIEVYKLAMAEFHAECLVSLEAVEAAEVVEEKPVVETVSTADEILAFRNQIAEENKIIEEYGFFFTTESDDTTVIFLNPCGKNETNFEEFSQFITMKTGIEVTESQIKELYDIQQAGYKGYVNVDANHYLFCPIKANGFSIRLCIGKQDTLKA